MYKLSYWNEIVSFCHKYDWLNCFTNNNFGIPLCISKRKIKIPIMTAKSLLLKQDSILNKNINTKNLLIKKAKSINKLL